MHAEPAPRVKVLWIARLEYRFHAWRERRSRARGLRPSVSAYPGYGGEDWVRVLGRVLIVPPVRTRRRTRHRGEDIGVRGWRSFAAVPVGYAHVTVTIDGVSHDVVADRGGVVDTVLPARLQPGWQPLTMTVEGSEPFETRVFVVGADVRFGVISDVDDTVMVTALPRPLVAAWNSFVLDEHARQPVPGMAVLLERLVRESPGAPVVYLSTGAWNVAPTLQRFLRRHLFPPGALLLTDWGPTHDRWFRSGRAHKERACAAVVIIAFFKRGNITQVLYADAQGQVFVHIESGDQIHRGVCLGEGRSGRRHKLLPDVLRAEVKRPCIGHAPVQRSVGGDLRHH